MVSFSSRLILLISLAFALHLFLLQNAGLPLFENKILASYIINTLLTVGIVFLLFKLKEKYTIIVVTHNMQQASRISDYTAFFYLGELIEYNKTRTIFTKPEKKQTENVTIQEAYLKWYTNYEKYLTFQNAVENAELRLKAVKESANFGDRAIIDTTEAFISLANRQLSLQSALRDFQNSEALLETFLWTNGTVPLEIENTFPNKPLESDIYFGEKTIDEPIISEHPFIQIQQFKINQSTINLKLKKEQLKPDVSLKYNLLNEPIGNNPFAQYAVTNYQWGASLNYAFISRKQRGDVRLANIKLEDQKLSLGLKEQEMEYKISAAQNNYSTAISLALLTEKIVQSNLTLYTSEQAMFNIGESSVFMINTRETNYLKAQKENIDALFTQFQSLNELRYILQY